MISVLSSLPEVLDGLDDAADLVVGVGEVGAVDVRLPDEELLLVEAERSPIPAARSATASAGRSRA